MAAVMKPSSRMRSKSVSTKPMGSDPDSAPEVIEDKRTTSDSKVVIDKYAKGRMLGKGGFAKCYSATCLRSNKEYALKVVQKESLLKLKSRLKFQSEINIHKSLNHEYIVRFDRFFEDHANAYIRMELCSNNSMSELQKRRKRLTEPEARYFLSQLVAGMGYLHNNLIIHRDLKLGNLFIDENMCIKIGDFGLATRLAFPTERKRTVCGTPNYIAPEILEGKDGHSFEVDVWSIGVIIYTMIVGRPPFECKDVKSTYKKILSNSFTYPELVPVSDGAKTIIQEILQSRPERRLTLSMIKDHKYLASGYIPAKLPLSAMVQPPESCLSSLPPAKKDVRETVPSNDENDRLAINRVAGAAGSVTNHVKTASKVIAEVNTNRSFKVRGNVADGSSATEKSAQVKPTRSASAMHVRPTSRPKQAEAQKFTIYSDNDNLTAEAGTAPAQKWSWQHQDSGKPLARKDQNPPLLPYEKDKGSNWAKERSENVEKRSWRAAAPKAPEQDSSSAPQPQAPQEVAVEGDEELGLDKLDWNMDRMSLGKSEKRDSTAGYTDHSRRDSTEDNSSRVRSVSHTTPVTAGTRAAQRPLRTLEAIHDTLSQKAAATETGSSALEDMVAKTSSDIWVVRYMDYTSKYGLGFLLNNGCSGVYFNDSTKVILSADGQVFQYFERRHRNSASCTSEGDHMKTTYMLSAHPPELVKKVTLLRHFRDYLLDRRTSDSPTVPEGKGNLVPANPVALPAAAPGTAPWTLEGRGEDLEKWPDIPYLKKWVRTRHAVLFRLSNRSVQVSFFDTTEVLLSAEANIVIYSDREGARTNHILKDVMDSGRADIVKRLKYTKDIMYRLINLQN